MLFKSFGGFLFIMEQEMWKDIPEYEGIYQVSNLGKIRSVKRKCYKERVLCKQHGYNHITFSKNKSFKKFQVHRLVAICFIDNPEKKRCVNHINGIKTDNRVVNLEWCTHSENELHSYHILNKKSPATKLKQSDVDYIRQNTVFGKKGNSVAMAKKFGIYLVHIHNIYKYKSWV